MGQASASANTWKVGAALLWGTALAAAFATTVPRPWALAIIGLGLGCLSGHLRVRATAAGRPARAANVLAWLCGVGLLVLAAAIAQDMFIGAWAASFAGYLFADRMYSLAASHRKEQPPSDVAADGA